MSKGNLKLLSVKEVAEIFGVNPMTIYRKVKRGEFPAIKFGKSWLFPEDTLQEWIRSQIKTPTTKYQPPNLKDSSLDDVATALKKLPEVQLFFFFGSAFTGENLPQSDIDFAYLDDSTTSSFDLEAKLEKIILEALPSAPRIDLVRLNNAPTAIKYRAIRDGKLVYKTSDEILSGFIEKVVSEFLDYAPILSHFYNDALKDVKEVA